MIDPPFMFRNCPFMRCIPKFDILLEEEQFLIWELGLRRRGRRVAEVSAVSRRAIDGGRVEIEGLGDYTQPWASFAEVYVGQALMEVATGPRSWGFEVAESAGVRLERHTATRTAPFTSERPRPMSPKPSLRVNIIWLFGQTTLSRSRHMAIRMCPTLLPFSSTLRSNETPPEWLCNRKFNRARFI